MKKTFLLFLMGCFGLFSAQAAPQLPAKVEASLPQVLLKKTITEDEVNQLSRTADWGQSSRASKYWKVYSDRSHNTTYNSPSVSGGKCDELAFNEELRIAKIQNGFALVYTETQKGFAYPQISSSAKSRGWVPMKNLLLWSSCPTDEHGIYKKALIVTNIEGVQKGLKDIGKRYENPESKDAPKKLVADMNFYFVMKKAAGDMVLLAKECKMDGYTYQVLYGWVSGSSYVPWDQRTCIEPNWAPQVAEDLKGTEVAVTREGKRGTTIKMGRENGRTKNPSTKYRLEPQLLRYPLLTAKQQYEVTAFARPNGEGHVPTVPTGSDDSSAEIVESKLKEASVINLIVVIDGTRSMEAYYQPMQKVIQDAYKTFGNENRTVKVGVVIYRDYADGEYITEMLTMRSPTDASVAQFLSTGGKYGIKSATGDRTDAEALYKGLEVALDAQKMGYNKNNSNLMLVVGDCGNDLNDKRCLSQEAIIKKCADNRIQLVAFQVRNNDSQAFLLFRDQMGDIVRGNLKAQNAFKVEDPTKYKAKIKELEDGYEYATNLPASKSFFIGAMRNAAMNKEMEVPKLYELVRNCYTKFNVALDAQSGFIYHAEEYIQSTESAKGATNGSMEDSFLKGIFSDAEIAALKKDNSLMAFNGMTEIKSPKGQDYWQPIIYISSDEFAQLMEKLEPVNRAAGTGNRKPYVDAMKELVRSMVPDITQQEMDQMDTKAIMALVAGLNVKSGSLGGHSLSEIQSENIVNPAEFDGMVAEFQNKYRKLKKIRENKYDFSVERNKTTWYWIPVEDLP